VEEVQEGPAALGRTSGGFGPADTENGVVIPDPFYSDPERPRIKDNYERELALLVPKDAAGKILALGLP
jgi:hypothetical protein